MQLVRSAVHICNLFILKRVYLIEIAMIVISICLSATQLTIRYWLFQVQCICMGTQACVSRTSSRGLHVCNVNSAIQWRTILSERPVNTV